MQGEASSVVKKEKRSAVLGVVVDRADSEFIAYAVAAAHKLGIGKRGQFVGFPYSDSSGRFVDTKGKVVCNIGFVCDVLVGECLACHVAGSSAKDVLFVTWLGLKEFCELSSDCIE